MKLLTRYLELRRPDAVWLLLLLTLVLLAPQATSNDYYLNLMVLALLYAGLASAWNIIGGIAGQFSLGHTAFFGIGAYTSTILFNYAGVSPWFGMLVGAAISVAFAVLIAYPAFRMRGVFFAMTTLAFGETVRILLIYSRKHVDLPYGLSVAFTPGWSNMVFAERWAYAYLAGAYLLLVVATAFVLSRSYTGYYLRALRDSEEAADAAGVPVRRYKLVAFVISAFLTSIGGTLMAQYVMYIEPGTVFTVALSVDLALMAILGGVGTLAGPVIGALLAVPLREFLVEAFGQAGAGTHLVVYGLLLVVIVIVLPHGLVGGMRQLHRRISGEPAAARMREAAR